MKLFIHTLGCKVNQYESQAVAEKFIAIGAEITNDYSSADIILVNSCTVTAESSRKTRQAVRKYRKSNPHAVIILSGCMTSAFPKTAQELPEANIIIGNNSYSDIIDIYKRFTDSDSSQLIEIKEHQKGEEIEQLKISSFNERTRAYIKVQDGCNRFCSYCAIPYARGRVRSRNIDEIYNEAAILSKNGYKEIVLVGINLTSYGSDTDKNLCDVVECIAKIPEIKRIRFGSIEPDHITDEYLERLAKVDKFCPQFHLSLQSGCDKTLKDMNRHYDTAFYADLVKRIRAKFDNSAITTDIMVGFAGESDDDFASSLSFCESIGFARMHVFAYSKREGTRAYDFSGHISNAVKEARSKQMTEVAIKNEAAFLKTQIGKTVNVLFEQLENGKWYGYSENYSKVVVNSCHDLNNEILPVIITKSFNDYCEGELAK